MRRAFSPFLCPSVFSVDQNASQGNKKAECSGWKRTKEGNRSLPTNHTNHTNLKTAEIRLIRVIRRQKCSLPALCFFRVFRVFRGPRSALRIRSHVLNSLAKNPGCCVLGSC